METSSTDRRIDDLSDRVGRFEERVDSRFDRFEDKVYARFERFESSVDARFGRLESKIDLTNRTIWGGIFAAAMIKILFG